MKLIFPYSYVYVFLFLLGIIPPLPQISGYTHWIVTQHGMLEPITTSYYHLRQPWNLVKLIQHEKNWEFVQKIEMKLNKVSSDLNENQEYQNKVQKYYVDSDSACVKASKLLSEFDLYSTHILTLEAKGVVSSSYLDERLLQDVRDGVLTQPICQSVFRRNFSMCCYEHLEALRNRSGLVAAIAGSAGGTGGPEGGGSSSGGGGGVPEISLYKLAMPQHLTPAEYGHLVATALMGGGHADPARNWVLYNMAAFFWRVKGAATNAIECLRAALHTSPAHHQDVALVSLANVLHAARLASLDAVVLMQNAVLVSPQFASHQMILGNIYASLGQFNASLQHYQNAAAMHRPGHDRVRLQDIEDRIFAARCSHELSAAISIQQRNLDKQVEELESFQTETARFQDAKSALALDTASNTSQQHTHMAYVTYVAEEAARSMLETKCVISDLPCEPHEQRLIAAVFGGWNATVTTRRQSSLPVMQRSSPPTKNLDRPSKPRLYAQLDSDLHKPDGTPPVNETTCQRIRCSHLKKFVMADEPFSICLSPRNKGFELEGLLTSKQGLSGMEEHVLPWYPPYCPLYVNKTELAPLDAVDSLESVRQRNQMKPHEDELATYADKTLVHELVRLVSNDQTRLEDIGQRIVTAMKRRLASHWIVFNVAGLYWRAMGNLVHAIECYRLAAKLSPIEYRDVSLLNLAAVLARLDKTADALSLVKAALHIDFSEPETHFLAAILYNEDEKFALAHHHLTIANRQKPNMEPSHFNTDFIKCQLCQRLHRYNATRHSNKRNADLRNNVTQIFLNYKMCSSTIECSNIVAQNYQFLPHIKVTIKGPTFSTSDIEKLTTIDLDSLNHDASKYHVMYGILWNTNLSNLHIQEHDCLLTNDSSRSAGCNRNEEIFAASQNVINFLAELRTLLENISKTVVDNVSTKRSENKHVCHADRSQKSRQDDDSNPVDNVNTKDIQDTIIDLISSRVVLSPLAPEDCENVAPFDFKTYTPLYVSLNTMRINVIALVDSLVPGYTFSFNQQPHCVPSGQSFLRKIIEKHQIDLDACQHSKVPEYNLHASFLKTFDDKYSLEDIGKRLYTGLEQNSTDWRLATIIVNYWRVSGDAKKAFDCLELAMENSPEFHEKVILVNAANILYRMNKLEAALEITHKSMQYPDSQNWIVIPFLVANIFATMEQWHKATLFYEACLSLKADFEEAIYRIKSIQCQQMVLKNLEQH